MKSLLSVFAMLFIAASAALAADPLPVIPGAAGFGIETPAGSGRHVLNSKLAPDWDRNLVGYWNFDDGTTKSAARDGIAGKLQGERRAKRRGQSVEFADHRRYVVGDDLRFVDWNIYGRLDQLFLKLFLEELDLSVQILVDVSGSADTGDPAKGLAMRKLAAALAYVGLVNNSRVTLTAFADGIVGQAPALEIHL